MPEKVTPAEEETCPTCHNPLKRWGCKHVESVGAFCRWPCICPFGVLRGDCSIHGHLVPDF